MYVVGKRTGVQTGNYGKPGYGKGEEKMGGR
jgi:hypothetical protein